jgi:hypothetical protein
LGAAGHGPRGRPVHAYRGPKSNFAGFRCIGRIVAAGIYRRRFRSG